MFMLLAGTVSGWAWNTLTLRSDLNGSWNDNVGTFTSFNNDGNHFKYEFTANSSKDMYYRIHVSDNNGFQIYPKSDGLDPTASGTYNVYANSDYTILSFCSAIVYGHKYQILAEYLNEDGWKWKITFKEESTSPVEKEWYLAGSMNGSGNWDDQKVKMTESTTGVYTVTKSLTQGDYLFKIKDSSSWYGNSGTMTRDNCSGWVMATTVNYDCKLTADVTGDYIFTFDESTKKLSVTYPENSAWKLHYSLDGSNWSDAIMKFTSSNTVVANINIPTGVTAKFKVNDGSTWYGNTGTMTRTNCSGWTMSTTVDGNCGLTADITGNYIFTFNTSDKKLTATYPEMSGATMYLRGSFNGDNQTGWDNLSRVMVETGKNTNVYEYSMPANTLSAGDYQFKFDMSGVTGLGKAWPDGLCWGYDLQNIDLNSTYTSVTTSGKATNIKLHLTSTDVTKTLKFMFNRNDMTFMVSSEELLDQNLRFENVTSTIKSGTNVTNEAISDVTNNTITYAVTKGEDVVSVNASTGEVTALKEGTAIITASSPAISGYYAATASYVITVTADETIPMIEFSPEGGTYTTNQDITITVSDATSASYTVNNGTPITINGNTANVTVSTTSTITVTANYGSGKKVTKTATYTINKEQPTGKNAVTFYLSVNDDYSWFPLKPGSETDGDQENGENFYIFAFVDKNKNGKYDAGDTKLTTNDFAPAKGNNAGKVNGIYGDYRDATEYPVYVPGVNQTFKRAKFVLYYDNTLENENILVGFNNGRGGTDGLNGKDGVGVLRLSAKNSNNSGKTDSDKATAFYYPWIDVKLVDDMKYYYRVGWHSHQQYQTELDYGYYTVKDASQDGGASLLFTPVTLDDDYKNGSIYHKYTTATTTSGKQYYTELINYWDPNGEYNINMYRPFYSDGQFESICLPFDVTASEVKEKFGEETKLYEVIGVTSTTLKLKEDKAITAGVPYFILPDLGSDHTWAADAENGTVISFLAKTMKGAYNTIISQNSLSYINNNVQENFTMKGCFTPATIGKNDRFVYFDSQNSKFFYALPKAYVIRGTRAFFTDSADKDLVYPDQHSKSALRIIIDGIDDESTTAILLPENNMISVKDNRIYNISGQYVGSSIGNLSKGIYVIDGKKFVIK